LAVDSQECAWLNSLVCNPINAAIEAITN